MTLLERMQLVMPVPLRGAAKAVLVALAYHGLKCTAGQDKLALESGYSAKSVRAALATLEAQGLISVRHGRTTNTATLNVDAIRAATARERPKGKPVTRKVVPFSRKVVPTGHSEGSSAQSEGSSESNGVGHSEATSGHSEATSVLTRKVVPTNQEENQEKNQEGSPPSPPKRGGSPYHETIRLWDLEHEAAFGSRYPWRFKGRSSDGGRVKAWIASAPPDRLQSAFRAYFGAVKAGRAWPQGEPPQTRHFDRDLSRWLSSVKLQEPPASGHDRIDATNAGLTAFLNRHASE